MRHAVLWLLRVLLRVFFRRIEVVGAARLPREGGVIFAPNHPNALVDPLFLLVLPDRPVSFLAKEPLFHMPVVATFVRAVRCLPVYRPRDGHDTSANERTLAAARALLETGGAIGIFPEGTSHSGAALQPLKTGAARIALGARAGSEAPVHVVPCALHYTDKSIFRSYAALVYGAPIEVERVAPDAEGQPPREAVRALTDAIRGGIEELVLHADRTDTLQLVASAARLVEGARRDRAEEPRLPQLDADESAGEVERGWRLSRLLLTRHAELGASHPERVRDVSDRIRALEHALALHGLDLRAPLAAGDSPAGLPLSRVLKALLVTPAALLGIALHYLPYRAIGLLAARAAGKEDDVIATAKLLVGLLGFPLYWVALGVGVGLWLGLPYGVVCALSAPLLAWFSLWWSEQVEAFRGRMRGQRALGLPDVGALREERDRLYDDLVALEELAQNSQVRSSL